MRTPQTLRVRLICLTAVLFTGTALLAAILLAKHNGYYIAINDSLSFPNRIYLAKEITHSREKTSDKTFDDKGISNDGSLRFKRGSIVICQIELPNTPYEEKVNNRDLFKRVSCMEGDYLKRVKNLFICNTADGTDGTAKEEAEAVAIVRSYDSEGKPYAINFDYDGTIPKDKLFVTAPHYMSFDSRYFGFIDVKAVKGEIIWAIY